MRVLIADDNATMRSMLQHSLEKVGTFDIETAADGISALTIFRKKPIDLLIIDNYMPKMDGFDVIKEIRYDASFKNTHVMFLTSRATKELVLKIRSERLRVDYFIAKPFDIEKVAECVSGIYAKIKQSRRDDQTTGAGEKRSAVRYSNPVLRVKTFTGISTTINWSMSGVLINHSGPTRFIKGSVIPAKIATEVKRGHAEARLSVVIDDPCKGITAMKFIDSDQLLLDYLKSLT